MVTKITLRNVDALQAQALSRLTLLMMGQTHRLFGEFQDWLIGQVTRQSDDQGVVNGAALISGFSAIADRYRRTVSQWTAILEQARVQAASIPFGLLLVKHNAFMGSLTEDLSAQNVQTVIQLWQQRRQRALQAAQQRVYGDGLQLSQRIWRLESGGLQQIRATLATAMAERTSAADLANRLEGVLGADQDMPRWTAERLYDMTPAQRLASREGLLTGTAERAQGIAYNALRLARTELQYANHAVTTEIAKHAPWVTGRWVRLSPAHPKIDVCDGLANGGPYAKDSDLLPAHPQCVTPGQLVNTKRGMIPIEQVRTGDRVLTHKGRYRRVKATWSNPHDDLVYEFDTPCGRFEVTGNHSILLRRGWVNAEFVKPRDEVLYASPNISIDLLSVETKNVPSLFGQKSIPLGVEFGFVPVPPTIAFNGNLDGNQGKVNEIPVDLELSFVGNTRLVEGDDHGGFQGAGVSESEGAIAQEHGHKAGVASLFGLRDFGTHFRALCRIVFSNKIKASASFAHLLAGRHRSRAIVFRPSDFDGFASGSHGDTMQRQQFAQPTVGQAVASEDFRRFELLFDVDLLKELEDREFVFGFDSQDVKLNASQSVLLEVGSGYALHVVAANGASDHDSVLSLNPDGQWGAESGNSGVNGVANPIQALGNYTTITGVKQRKYTGPVYNMEVEDDHSYTVNGAAVHNCMCYWEEQVMSAGVFKSQVADWLAGESDFLDDYRDWLGVQQVTEPLPTSMSVADALELWLSTSRRDQAAALNL